MFANAEYPKHESLSCCDFNDFFRTKQCYSQVLADIGKEGAQI